MDNLLGKDTHLLFVIGGPCVIESVDQCLMIAEHMKGVCEKLRIKYIFKASFDKANRSSNASFRGPGMEEGLKILARVKKEVGVAVLTDIHEVHQAAPVAEVVDILQIPAFLARQTDLLQAAGATGRVVNIKKGQFMAPSEMGNAVEKVKSGRGSRGAGHGSSQRSEVRGQRSGGEAPIMLTERGTFFGYGRLVNDFTGIAIMKETLCPVVFDVTHSTQMPAGLGHSSGGNPQYSPMLARAAVAAGVDGLFLECHPDPKNAKSDAATVLDLGMMEGLMKSVAEIAEIRRGWI